MSNSTKDNNIEKPGTYKAPQIKLSYVADCECELPVLNSSEIVARFMRSIWDADTIDFTESMKAVFLNRRLKVLGFINLSEGSDSATVFNLKSLLAAAILSNAHGVILTHNHPSGTLSPSVADDKITIEAAAGLKAVGLKLLDHVIITRGGFYSYSDRGKIR